MTYPDMVQEYNESMGGMNLNNIIISSSSMETWRLSSISSTFIMSMVGYSIEDIE